MPMKGNPMSLAEEWRARREAAEGRKPWYQTVYAGPEAYGLTVVAEVEASPGSYDFDTWMLWRDARGTYWWAEDEGCSCPEPFAGKDLTNMPSGSLRDAITDLKAWMRRVDYLVREREAVGLPVLARLEGMIREH
jgi:hypothetical protein